MYSTTRCVAGAPLTVTYTPVDAEGEPSGVDPGVVTVNVARSDGTAVVTGAATTGAGATPRTYTLTATVTEALDQLTVTWLVGATVVHRTVVDVVGGVYCTVGQIRDGERPLSDVAKYPADRLKQARLVVESMVERACGHVVSFVPKFAITQDAHLAGADLLLPHAHVRSVRWVSYVDGVGAVVPVDISAGVGVYPDGVIRLRSSHWPRERTLVGYEHGLTAPDPELQGVVIQAIRRQVNKSGIDSRVMSHTTPEGETQRFPTPGLGPWVTGIPEVDEVLKTYRERYVSPGLA